MAGYPDAPFPQRPFFSCGTDEFLVIDRSDMGALLRGGEVTPWMRLEVGPGNVLEATPRSVVEHSGTSVVVDCEDGVLELDFYDETARKTTANGDRVVYLGGLDEANDGKGWIPAG